MAKEPGRNNSTDELKVKIARSRDRVTRDFRGVRHELDIPRKIRRSFREHTLLWVGAAAVVGTLVVLAPIRQKKVYVDLASGKETKAKGKLLEAGFLLGALRIAMTLLRPSIERIVGKKLSGYVSGQQSRKG